MSRPKFALTLDPLFDSNQLRVQWVQAINMTVATHE